MRTWLLLLLARNGKESVGWFVGEGLWKWGKFVGFDWIAEVFERSFWNSVSIGVEITALMAFVNDEEEMQEV